jgi:leucyl/phenylalanyl-tRNA--protein transferase
MAVIFPDPRSADEDGIVAIGGDFSTEILLAAYRQGIFPWPMTLRDRQGEERWAPLTWFSPDPRAVLFFDELHVPRSLERSQRRAQWTYSWNKAFDQVILECAQQHRPGQKGTWITEELKDGYEELFRQGHAWSVEVWDGAVLVGGIYGVLIEGYCSGESMFHRQTDASKASIVQAVQELKKRGCNWMDIQMLTPHMERLGAREIARDEFLGLCRQAMPKRS